MSQGGPELGPAPVDTTAHGADLDVEHRSDLFVAETLDVTEHDRRSKFRRQGGKGSSDVMVEVGVGELFRRRRPGAGQPVGRSFDQPVEADLLLSAGAVEKQVRRDPVQPTLEGAGLESVQRAKDADENVLGQIFGVVRIAREPVCKPVDPRAVVTDDLLPGRRHPVRRRILLRQ